MQCPILEHDPSVLIINDNKKTDDSFSNIPCQIYFGRSLESFLAEGNVNKGKDETNKNEFALLIHDIRFIFLISSNVLKLNKLLNNNYIIYLVQMIISNSYMRFNNTYVKAYYLLSSIKSR